MGPARPAAQRVIGAHIPGPVGQEVHPVAIDRRTIAIYCSRCRALLYRYYKGGNGGLVKCLVERIAEDHTRGDCRCPECGQEFARVRLMEGKPAHKIIQGKVYTRGMARR